MQQFHFTFFPLWTLYQVIILDSNGFELILKLFIYSALLDADWMYFALQFSYFNFNEFSFNILTKNRCSLRMQNRVKKNIYF